MWELHVKLAARLGLKLRPLHVAENDVTPLVSVARDVTKDELQRFQRRRCSIQRRVDFRVVLLADEPRTVVWPLAVSVADVQPSAADGFTVA